MKLLGANISVDVFDLLSDFIKESDSCESVNLKLLNFSGIRDFFDSENEFTLLKKAIFSKGSFVAENDRCEYGDFQTNINLCSQVTGYLSRNNIVPDIIIEPTCGKGSFIIAAIETFPSVEKIIGVEIFDQYVWEAKFNILSFYIQRERKTKPVIQIICSDVFEFNFKKVARDNPRKKFLVLGNPPWVTNAKLSILESENLPSKSNFKKHKGIDAITGKGNFDIGEFVSLMMIEAFHNSDGWFAFLLKNSVIKNIVFDQRQRMFKISNIRKFSIDSKKEFNVAVEAALFYCEFNKSEEFVVKEDVLIGKNMKNFSFGWVKNDFVSDVDKYKYTSDIEGKCQFEWRQGIKHDLSMIMELEKKNNIYVNGQGKEFELEEDLVYGFLKSSDLKVPVIRDCRKITIVTQKTVGESTHYIKELFPKTFDYLKQNEEKFKQRKSSIYKNKPDYSIFGVGEYSFKPFKVAISGLYKRYLFSLILPIYEKPAMLDDTCYMIGFDNIEYAAYSMILLNSEKAEDFLKSITFPDAKRIFTKDGLMRVDLLKLLQTVKQEYMHAEVKKLNDSFMLGIKDNRLNDYKNLLVKFSDSQQMSIFENK